MSKKMSLLDTFKENTSIFRGDESRIDQTAFDELIKERGEDVAKGYLKAIVEFVEVIDMILLTQSGEERGLPEKPAHIQGRMSNLHIAIFEFVKQNGINTDHLNRPFPFRSRHKGW